MTHTHDSFTNWMTSNFEVNELCGIAEHGADAGWSGITYYSETSQLYYEYCEEIWQWLTEDAESYGYKTILEFIGSFEYANSIDSEISLANTLVWYAAERVAQNCVNELEAE